MTAAFIYLAIGAAIVGLFVGEDVGDDPFQYAATNRALALHRHHRCRSHDPRRNPPWRSLDG